MTPTAKKLRPAVKTHGGKAYLARRIVALFPAHSTYCEPFAGGASVLLNKPRAPVEVLGDLDAGLMGFYRVLRDNPGELAAALDAIPYDRETWARARLDRPSDPVRAAVAFLVVNRMSRGGLGGSFAWSERTRGGRPGDLNAWETSKALLPTLARRLRGVELVEGPALATIRRHDGPGTLSYCDPPYLPSTRTVRDAYRHEMTEADHSALLDTLARCRGPVILSGYPSALYDSRLPGWERLDLDMPNHAGQGQAKRRRTECLWISPAAAAAAVVLRNCGSGRPRKAEDE